MATMQKKSFWQQYGSLILILGGIIIGALIGAFAPNVGTTIKPVGDIFLNLLFTIVVPLVFVSIASAVGSMANMKRLGRILGGTIGTFIFTGLIASACVLIWVNLFSPSAGTTIEMTTSEVGEAKTAAELIVTSLTENFINPVISLLTGAERYTLQDAAGFASNFASSLVNFLIMALILFCMMKGVNKLLSLGRKPAAPAAPTTKKCPYCLSDIPIGATRCPHCTSQLEETAAVR